MGKLWANTYEPLLCPTCGYNMGQPDPNNPAEKGQQCSDCAVTQPRRGSTVDHLIEMLTAGGMNQQQFLATLVDMARNGGEEAQAARNAVGGNPHALDALAAQDGGFVGPVGESFDPPPPARPKAGPDSPVADAPVLTPDGAPLRDPIEMVKAMKR